MATPPPLPAAVVFDLDGTLIDSAGEIAAAINNLLDEYKRPALSLEQIKVFIGEGAHLLVERCFAATGEALSKLDLHKAAERYVDLYQAQPVRPETIYPGVMDALRGLKDRGVRMGVCTNKAERATHSLLAELDMSHWFEAIVGGDTLPWRKPDGRPLMWILNHFGIAPEQALMVGDSINDVGTARAAGVPVFAVSYGYPRMPLQNLKADRVINSLMEILQG